MTYPALRRYAFCKAAVSSGDDCWRASAQPGIITISALSSSASPPSVCSCIPFKPRQSEPLSAETVYLAGDTIWRPEVDAALARFKPEIIILNTSYAKVNGYENDSIVMGKDDVAKAYRVAQNAIIVTTHMDAVNHATLSRAELRDFIQVQGWQTRVLVPDDGQSYRF